MKKRIILYFLIFLGVFGYSQNEKVTLENGVEIEFIKEKRKGSKILIEIAKPKCFQDFVTLETMDKPLEEYAERSSYLKNKVHFSYDKIEYETDGGFEKAILDTKNLIEYFDIGTPKVYLSELTRFSKEKAVEEGGIKEYAINKVYPYYSYPLLQKNITSKKVRQLSETYKNSIGINNIKVKVFGRGNERLAAKTFEKIFKQLSLDQVDLTCSKVKVSTPFFIYKSFPNRKKGIELYSIYVQDKKLDESVKRAVIKAFGKGNSEVHSYDNFSEIHISQKTERNEGKGMLEKLKAFAKENRLDFKQFRIVITGSPEGVFKSFKGEGISYLNDKDQPIANPFIYKNIDLTGKEIIDKYLDAVSAGDRDYLKAIQNTRAKYDVVINSDTLNLKVEFLNALPHRSIRKMILEGEDISYNVFDGLRGWINKEGLIIDYDKEKEKEALSEETVFPQQFYPPSKVVVEGLVVEEDEKYEDKRFNQLKVTLDGYTVYEYYDPETGLLMKREFCKEEYTPIKTVYYGSYAKIKELLVPHRLRIVEDSKELKLTLSTFNVNSFIETNEFSKIDHFKLPGAKNFRKYIKSDEEIDENLVDKNKEGEVLVESSEQIKVSEKIIEKKKVLINKKEEPITEDYKNGDIIIHNGNSFKNDKKSNYITEVPKEYNKENKTKYLVIVGVFKSKKGVDLTLKNLLKKNISHATSLKVNNAYYVVEGTYETRNEAQKRVNSLGKKVKGAWIFEKK